jgi:1-deoxy-D-xylulose-5-phosphate synthase
MVAPSLEAHHQLKEQGIQSTVVNCRFVKPLDAELICTLANAIPDIITVEENALQGGFGSAVLELLSDQSIGPVRVKRIGIADRFIEHGNVATLRKKYGLDAGGIVAAARKLLGNDRSPRTSYSPTIQIAVK